MKRFSVCDFLFLILIVIFFVCLAVLGHRMYQYHKGTEIYDEAKYLAKIPNLRESTFSHTGDNVSDDNTSASIDLTSLREVNSDVLGWITIPDTVLSYPLVQGDDNEFYLTHTWNHESNSAGSIFMESECSPDFTDFNTIIYGHRMNNGSMFGSLKDYKKQAHYEAHPLFYIMNENGLQVYQIFSAFEAQLYDPVFLLKVTSEKNRQAVIDCAIEKSQLSTNIIPTAANKIVTLSTCTGRGHDTRWVVIGFLVSNPRRQPNPDW